MALNLGLYSISKPHYMYMFQQLNISTDEEIFTVGPDLYAAIGVLQRDFP